MNQKTEQKQRSHQAILDSAAVLLRQRGIRASSVLDVMQGAGLTVGGFYGHFDSKEQLFTQALSHAASEMWQKLQNSARGSSARERLLSVLGIYLSRKHRDNPESGCLLPNVIADVAREGEPYRSALVNELSSFLGYLAELLGRGAHGRETALGLLALMYGALSLARGLAGTPLSDEILQAAKKVGARIIAEEGP
jgi:TetR/AcrR family transcriptional repressor of nem operon